MHLPLKKFFHEMSGSLLELFFPANCMACGRPPVRDEGLMLCSSCRNEVESIKEPFCSCCGRHFPKAAGGNHLCDLCLTGYYHFDLARSLLKYSPPVTTIISRFKYQGQTAGLKSFRALFEQLPDRKLFSRIDLITPVPLHVKRLRERGFNQALLLARTLFPKKNTLIDFKVLERKRYTEPQTNLSGKARRLNLKKAFQVTDRGLINGKKILLIDDVLTTGTTVNECAKVLKKAGASEVLVLTLARVD